MSVQSISEWLFTHFFQEIPQFFSPLFQKEEPVWKALARIGPFLHTCQLGVHEGTISPKAHLENPQLITICKGAKVEPFAFIQGPCWIGSGAEVRQGAYIRGNVVAGERSVIGHGTEIKNSCLFPEVHADHFAYIGDSILGKGAHLGAGAILANLRLDRGEVTIKGVATGLKKMGAILGDGVEVGCNTVINPGSLLFPKSAIFPQINWGGVLLAKEVVKAK